MGHESHLPGARGRPGKCLPRCRYTSGVTKSMDFPSAHGRKVVVVYNVVRSASERNGEGFCVISVNLTAVC